MVTLPLFTLTTLALVLQWIREFLIETLGASMVTHPEMSRPSMTVPGVVMSIPPLDRSDVPAGTPVFDAPGWPASPAGFAITAGCWDGAAVIDGFEVVAAAAAFTGAECVAVAVGVGVAVADRVLVAGDGVVEAVCGRGFVVERTTCGATFDAECDAATVGVVEVGAALASTSLTADGS